VLFLLLPGQLPHSRTITISNCVVLENNGEREKVPKDQRLLLLDNKHVSTKVESRETWKNTASPCWHLAQRTLLVRGRVGGWDLTQHLGELASFHPHCETPHSDTQLLSATSCPHTKTPVSLSLRFCNILCNIVCRIRRGVCFRNRAECY
jgi:hypothetical protein